MESFYPTFFIIIIALAITKRNNMMHHTMRISRKRKERRKMDNSLLLRYQNKVCIISANGYISGVVGKVIEVSDNWITVEDKKGKVTTFNCDYISSIREK